jgi:hypothetical protein
MVYKKIHLDSKGWGANVHATVSPRREIKVRDETAKGHVAKQPDQLRYPWGNVDNGEEGPRYDPDDDEDGWKEEQVTRCRRAAADGLGRAAGKDAKAPKSGL